jgi:hypothetical protein
MGSLKQITAWRGKKEGQFDPRPDPAPAAAHTADAGARPSGGGPHSPWAVEWDAERFAAAPALDEHGAALRAEFAAKACAAEQTTA